MACHMTLVAATMPASTQTESRNAFVGAQTNDESIGGSPKLFIPMLPKNAENASRTNAGTFSDISSVGGSGQDVTSLKEKIRLCFKFTKGSLGDFVFLVLTSPSWRSY